jgi:hypothetical protein
VFKCFYDALLKKKNAIAFTYFFCLKELTNSKDCSEMFVPAFLLFYWSIFSSVHPSLDAVKIRQDINVIENFRNNFQGNWSFRNNCKSHRKWLELFGT